MSLFKRKRKTGFQPNPLALRFNNQLLLLQERIAGYLNGRTQQLTRRQQLGVLAGICLLMGGASLYLLLKAIF